MSSLNKVILIGNLGRDPEVRNTKDGGTVVSLAVATSETWKDRESGERKERTEWHNVVIFNEPIGGIAERFCKKGTKVYIEGQIQTREYIDKDNNKRTVTDIVLTRFRGELLLLSEKPRNGKLELVSSKPSHRSAKDIINDEIPW